MLESAEVGNQVSKEDYKAALPELRLGLVDAQYKLRESDFPVVIWIAGDDSIAAHEMVNRLNEWMDTRYLDTRVFADESQEEAGRPALWRLWMALPPKGRVAIFAGGLMRMATMRANGTIDEEQLGARLRHLASTQTSLIADGVLLLKFFLHTPEKAQRKKLRKAEKDPYTGWWIDQRDWAALDRLGPTWPIAERILRDTSAPGAPWTIVESTDARYRDLSVGRAVLAAITQRLQSKPPGTPALAESVYADRDSDATALCRADLSLKLDKQTYREKLAAQQTKLYRLAMEARDRGISTVLAFEGWDAAGKGGAIRRVTRSLEPGEYRVVPVAAPSPEEAQYPYQWRFWRRLPAPGRFTIFDRTWYGRLLVERVEGFADPAAWQRAYDEINDFESQLVEHGCFVAKFWLHISPEEQLARFEARANTPYKQHKITEEDYRNREKWGDYVQAVDQMVQRTSSRDARWHVIPANDKYYARVAVLEAITKGLKRTLRRQ